jgi:hypothetical protein
MAKGSKVDSFLTLVVGGSAGFGLIVLTSRSWKACGVHLNGVGNGPTLFFAGIPVAFVVNLVLFNFVYRFSRKGQGFFTALLAATIAIAIADLALYSWAGTPNFTPSSLCPGNVPPWWPKSIPT